MQQAGLPWESLATDQMATWPAMACFRPLAFHTLRQKLWLHN
jgi:hypothetical protein